MQRTIPIPCPQCHSSKIVRNGRKYNGPQNYLCKDCVRRFISGRAKTYQGCIPRLVDLVKIMLVRGIGIRDINAVLNISIPKIPASTNYQIEPQQKHYGALETDEFWTYVGDKSTKVWLIAD